MLECALFGHYFRCVNHIESHSSLARDERRLHEIDGCCIVENTLGLSPQAQISTHDFCLGIRRLQGHFGFGGIANETEALPLIDEVWEEGGGLFSAGASDDEKIVGVVNHSAWFDL